jgi:hypothetical protein
LVYYVKLPFYKFKSQNKLREIRRRGSIEAMKRIISAVLLVVLALSIATGIYFLGLKNPLSEPVATPAPGGYTLINGNITVSNEYFIPFTIPSGAFDINVSGNFSVIGEGTIRVIVVNSTDFVSGFGLPTNYDSGQQSAGYINATLAPGATYYLVYANIVQWGYSQPTKIVDSNVDFSFWFT